MGKHTNKKDFLFEGTTVHAARTTEVIKFQLQCEQHNEIVAKEREAKQKEREARLAEIDRQIADGTLFSELNVPVPEDEPSDASDELDIEKIFGSLTEEEDSDSDSDSDSNN